MAAKVVTIKKYGNRRLYDTEESRYLTQDELAAKIRSGTDVKVIDAKSGADLTQATLTQIIIEGRGAGRLLPVPLLLQLIRLGDDHLAEFFGRYVGAALDLYMQARRGAEQIAPYNPFATIPFTATDALARLFMSNPGYARAAWSGMGGMPGMPGMGGMGGMGGPAPSVDVSPEPEPEPEPDPAPTPGRAQADGTRDELAALRRELEALKSALGGVAPSPEPETGRPRASRRKGRG
jgi:polyhydroxyalkanoate synthesis repressor PhaR